ncbi:MAG: pectate lyase [Prevotella sp.]
MRFSTLKNTVKRCVNAVAMILTMAKLPVLSSAQVVERTSAFPGAEGWGRYVTGGRGGQVVHVTNLNDSGSGSLRAAIEKDGTRTVVFDVSGTIHLKSDLNIRNANITIAGQTAPGDGICVADYPVVIKTHNVIIRFMRFRPGMNHGEEYDGLGGFDSWDIIIDHCSVSWSIDECLSVYGNDRMTVQWCIVSQSLRNSGHEKGAHGYGGNWGGRGATYHHNLLAHHDSRVPRLGDRPYLIDGTTPNLIDTTDLRNNVMYNWAGNGCYGGEAMHVNIVNNYYKPGPATMQRSSGSHAALKYRIAGIGVRSDPSEAAYGVWGKFYVDGNVNPESKAMTRNNWAYGIYQQVNSSNLNWNQATRDSIKLAEPLHFMKVTTHSAEDAYNMVLNYAGASLHRDSVDKMIVNDVSLGIASHTGTRDTGKGVDLPGIIDTPWDNRPEGVDSAAYNPWPTLKSEAAPADTDGDGMPDAWETANGLDPNDATDGARVTSDGYTNLEHYINSLVADIITSENAGGTEEGDIMVVKGTGNGEFTISNDTHTDDWNFAHGYTVSNEGGKTYTNNGDKIRYTANNVYTINLNGNMTVESVTISGQAYRASRPSYLVQLGDDTFNSDAYTFKRGTDATYDIKLGKAATDKLSFMFSADTDVTITLHAATTTGISNVSVQQLKRNDKRIYTVDGRYVGEELSKLPRGIYIQNNKKIVKF